MSYITSVTKEITIKGLAFHQCKKHWRSSCAKINGGDSGDYLKKRRRRHN
jgi:hypothetical protein